MNVACALLAAARSWKQETAAAGLDGTRISHAELRRRAGAIAGGLGARGLVPGDRVALAMTNRPEYFEILLGIWAAGLCAVPLNPRLHGREFAYAIADSGARLCFASPDLCTELAQAGCDVVVLDTAHYDVLRQGMPAAPVPRAADDLAWLFYTSGTTGRPKGAMLTHRNIMAFIVSMLADAGDAARSHVLHVAPLSHGSGFLGLVALMRGRTNVVLAQGGLNRNALAAALEAFAPLSFFAVPTLVDRLMDGMLSPGLVRRIGMIYFGGAPMYVEDLKRAIAFFGAGRLWHLYGQGEAPMTIAFFPPWLRGAPGDADYDSKLASVGIARSGVTIRVLDAKGTDCAPGEIGEVAVCGDVVMAGYWNDAAATAATLRDGWLLTGDLGAMDEDGFLTLHDRSKDLIISGGSNIYPREIEEVLLSHPGVRECAVVGRRDRKWGEVPVAFIVPAEGHAPEPLLLEAHCLAHLARYKRPHQYRLVQELPKNGYGKVMKAPLRALAEPG